MGIGVQGATYRFQVTEYGDFFFPITREIGFVLNGTYSGKTALSVILWVAGTMLLSSTVIYSFLHIDDTTVGYYRQIMQGLIIACGMYLGSCIEQYGYTFYGPAGISVPIGILLILGWIGIIYFYQNEICRFLELE